MVQRVDKGNYRMDIVTVSPKSQVVIPKAVREQLKLVPGQTVQIISHGCRSRRGFQWST